MPTFDDMYKEIIEFVQKKNFKKNTFAGGICHRVSIHDIACKPFLFFFFFFFSGVVSFRGGTHPKMAGLATDAPADRNTREALYPAHTLSTVEDPAALAITEGVASGPRNPPEPH